MRQLPHIHPERASGLGRANPTPPTRNSGGCPNQNRGFTAHYAGWLVLCFALGATACSEDSGTGGQRISFDLQVASDLVPGESFTTGRGWQVRLTQATLAAGPFYLWRDPPPVAVTPKPRSPWQRLADFLVPNAHAHAGDSHFAGGEVKGEYVGQLLVDALSDAPPVTLGSLRGSAGPVRSFSVVLDPPQRGLDDGRLHGHHAYVQGEARRAETTIRFSGGMDIGREGTQRLIDGIQTDLELQQGALVRLIIHATRWFEDADFEQLATLSTAPPEQDIFEIDQQSQVHAAWFIGLRSFDAFSMQSVVPGSP